MKDTNKSRGESADKYVTRRGALSSIGAVGLGAAGLPAFAERGSGQSGDRIEIPTIKAGETVVQTETVSRAWYQRVTAARHVTRQLVDRYRDVPGITGVARGFGSSTLGGRSAPELVMQVSPNGTSTSIPTEVNGFAVRTETARHESRDPVEACSDLEYNRGDYNPVPGGVYVTAKDGGCATATCAVRIDGSRYLMNCAHMFGCGGDHEGKILENDSGTDIGSVAYEDPTMDWTAVDLNSGYSADNTIEGEWGILSGRITADGVDTRASDNSTVYHMGAATGETSGTIEKSELVKFYNDCNGMNTKNYIKVTTPTDGGDSGGPHYEPYTYNSCEYLAVLGVHSGAESKVSAAHRIHDDSAINHKVYFDPGFEFGYCK